MTCDEIKQMYSMRDILERYGLRPNRSGFVKCPFHSGDHTASMKIYKDSYHCFGCNANGDIFSFIQRMDNCSFKDAFYQLGGIYEKPSFQSKMAVYHAKKLKETRIKAEEKESNQCKSLNKEITIYRLAVNNLEPLSDEWCFAFNELQKRLFEHCERNKIPF